MRNIRKVERLDAIYMRVLEGEGVEENPYREEEYLYIDKEDKLFVIDRSDGTMKRIYLEEEE